MEEGVSNEGGMQTMCEGRNKKNPTLFSLSISFFFLLQTNLQIQDTKTFNLGEIILTKTIKRQTNKEGGEGVGVGGGGRVEELVSKTKNLVFVKGVEGTFPHVGA